MYFRRDLSDQTGTLVLADSCRKLKKLQLLIQLFNQLNAYTVLFLKVGCNVIAILSAFCAVRFSHQPPLATFCLILVLDALVVFGGFYNSTFAIPQNFERTKKRLLIGSKVLSLRGRGAVEVEMATAIIVWEVASVRPLGIKVGDFRQLERQSTPNFIMFVLFNVGRLLVFSK
jgi:hypothetical protein